MHERPDPQAIELLLKKLADLGVPTPPVPKQLAPATAAQAAADVSERVADYVARSGPGPRGVPLARAAFAEAGALRPGEPRPLGPGEPRLLPLHLTDSPLSRTSSSTARYCGSSASPTSRSPSDLEGLAEHTSTRERDAAKIEYLADELCLAWLLEATLFERGWDDPFEGEIVGMIASGLFIRFGDVFEGYLPARRLPGDYFELNEARNSHVRPAGRRARYRLGDPIEVFVEKIERAEGKVELSQAGRTKR